MATAACNTANPTPTKPPSKEASVSMPNCSVQYLQNGLLGCVQVLDSRARIAVSVLNADCQDARKTREKTLKPLVILRGNRVTRGGNVAVVNQKVLRPEVRIECHGQQNVRQSMLDLWLLMHQLMTIVDANCTGNHAHPDKQKDIFPSGQIPACSVNQSTPESVQNWIGAQISVIKRYQNRSVSGVCGSSFCSFI